MDIVSLLELKIPIYPKRS